MNEEVKVKATLAFKRSELLYDIRNYCYIEGHIMSEGQENSRHTTKDVGEAGNVDRVTRLLNLLHAQAREMLYPYSKKECENPGAKTDVMAEPDEYEIELALPEGFSETTVELLEHYIHEWMVSRVVSDWLSISNPEKAGAWMMKAEDAETRIRTCTVARRGRVRRRMSPF